MELALIGSVMLWAAAAFAAVAVVPRLSRAFGVAALLVTGSTVALAIALISNDFSLAYVAKVSSFATPWPYRLASLWGGMEGSMLFYAAMTTVVAWWGLRRERSVHFGALVSFGLLLFTAVLVNPFERLDIPAVDGEGLLALLQHPAMIYHPPILYLGLTAFVVPFALTVGSVILSESGTEWLVPVRRWLLISWTLLTLGMVAGANWAYVELGWGGFWAWDPVENTALMPWLATTVFLHTSRIHERDGRMRRWSVIFGALPFVLTVLGLYLTRSGSTGSIHAFAEDPVIGRILLVGAIVMLGVVVVLGLRSPRGEAWERFGLGRDTWLGASGALVSVALVFITIGSAYPAYVQVFVGDEVSVGPRFFVSTVYPIALVMALLIGLAFSTRWSEEAITRRDVEILLVSFVAVGVVALAVAERRLVPIVLLAAAGAAGVLLVRSARRRRPKGRKLAGHLAHLGFAMVLIGAAGSALGADYEGEMAPGEEVEVAGKNISLQKISVGDAGRFIFVRATFNVDGTPSTPEIRAYEAQALPVAEPDLVTNPLGDVVIAISTVTADASAVNVSVFVRPMVWWVWAGALVLATAGSVALASTSGVDAVRRPGAREEQQSAGTAT